MAATTRVAGSEQPPAISTPEASTTFAPGARRLPWPRRILVGSGGSATAEPAIAIALALARRAGAAVELLAVFAPRIPTPARATPSKCEAPDRLQAAAMLKRVRAQRDAIVRSGPTWPMRFETGDPRHVIVRVAHERGADLVVIGIGRADPTQRRDGDITAAVIADHLDVPVYAAMPGYGELPARVVVLLPDGRMHAPTLRAALECAAPRAHLVVVRPLASAVPDRIDHRPHADVESESVALGAAESLLTDVAVESVESVELEGDVVSAAVAFARDRHVQLIAVPMRGASGSVRSLLPHHAAPLLLTSTCSVLVVPDPPVQVDPEFRAEARSAGVRNQVEGGAAC